MGRGKKKKDVGPEFKLQYHKKTKTKKMRKQIFLEVNYNFF
jgi:hypothetical protein